MLAAFHGRVGVIVVETDPGSLRAAFMNFVSPFQKPPGGKGLTTLSRGSERLLRRIACVAGCVPRLKPLCSLHRHTTAVWHSLAAIALS
jgi:hypothetical protein